MNIIRQKKKLKLLKIFAIFSAILIALPIFALISELFVIVFGLQSNEEILRNLHDFFKYLFLKFIGDTFITSTGVLFFSALIGVSTAYLIANYNFFLSKALELLLMLPLAIPAYILAFVYVGIADFDGILYELFSIRIDFFNIYGTIFVLAISLYPYVYIFSKTSFKAESFKSFEAAKMMGYSEFKIFYKLSIFISAPAIIAGLMLVLMESLSDYGASAYYGIDTFSAGIFKLWYDRADPYSSSILSALLMGFVFFLLFMEAKFKHKRRYASKQDASTFIIKRKLSPIKSAIACIYCLVILSLGFIFPFIWLLYWGLKDEKLFSMDFYTLAFNSICLGLVSALIITFLAFILAFVARASKEKLFAVLLLKFCSLGYSIPGAAIGISTALVFAYFDRLSGTQFLGISIFVLIFAYIVRFLAAALYSIDSGYTKINNNIDEASLHLKPSFFTLFSKIHFPLLKQFLLLSFIVVFIDIIKELPLTRILSPASFETLATKAYWYATDERIYNAALPSLLIVLLCLFALLWVEFFSKRT